MKKNIKNCIELIEADEPQCLLDMNHYERIEGAGLIPDLRHNRSAHMTAAWRFAEKKRACIPMSGADLSGYRYLTFSVFSTLGAGGSFSLMLDSSPRGEGKNGYEQTLLLTHDGWNDYRVELPFMHAVGEPLGWESIGSICFDCAYGYQTNREETVLYIDNLYVWEEMAPPLYTKLPELKGSAAFSKMGGYAIVDRKRIPNSIDGYDAKPFENEDGLWVPMAPVAGGIAHAAVSDTVANTLSFTYRRKKYSYAADEPFVTVNGEREALSFKPISRNGALFFPVQYVREFFRWRQIYVDPMGLILLSNRKNVFDPAKDESTVLQLVSDLTFRRPQGATVLNDLRRRFPNPTRGRLLAGFDDLMRLRRAVKTEPQLSEYFGRYQQTYGKKSEVFLSAPATEGGEGSVQALALAEERLWAFSLLYRATGEKLYCDRARAEAEAVAALESWSVSRETLGSISLAMAVCYDWCHHVWTEGQKAIVERAMLRNGMRVGVSYYQGKLPMWQAGTTDACVMNAGMLAMALALCDVYPETALKLLNASLRNVEPCFLAFAPDGGYAEGVGAWEKSVRALMLIVAMLNKACGSDYGLSAAPGFRSTSYFSVYNETVSGAWNYHNRNADPIDSSSLFFFSLMNLDPALAWMRRQQLLSGKKQVTPFDLLFFYPVEDTKAPRLALDTVYRKASLAMMRLGWDKEANVLGLHGGSNRVSDGDLDAGGFILEMGGERFFCETGGEETLPMMLRRRAVGQNTLIVDPTEEPYPDQNPGASVPLAEMRSDAARAYAVVDLSSTNDLLLRAKRGAMLTENRSVAVIQDELSVSEPTRVLWNVWTRAEVKLNKSGRIAKLTQNGKTLLCKLGGVGHPARFETETFEESGMTRLYVSFEVSERARMAVSCKLMTENTVASERLYELTPISNWSK